jgi:hypothetical protein
MNRAERTDLVRAKVTGAVPIRDYVTRESVQPGDVVTLAPRTLRDGNPEPDTVVIDALVASGAIDVLPESKPGPKAKS